jgi:glyoxylase-like metal-dependent hydrolase (beta-lactamase superfamily II)
VTASRSTELPETTSLGDGIVQVRLPMRGNPLRYINGYLLEDTDGLTLVDCGWKAADVLGVLQAGLTASGYALADVRRILVTHQHFDHYGLAGTLLRAGVAELGMHALDWERAQEILGRRDEFDRVSDAWLARHGFVVTEPEEGPGDRAELTPPTRTVADGEAIGRLTAVWTPGHTAGHLCFLDARSGRMLTGDHVLDPITPHVGFWRERPGDPLGDYIDSLKKVARLGRGGALPGHGEPFPDLGRRADQILEHTEAREQLVLAIAAKRGSISARDTASELPWTRRNRTFAELGAWHQEFAVSETIAHLEHLRTRGVMARDDGGDEITYRL